MVGGIFASFILTKKESDNVKTELNNTEISVNPIGGDPDKLFEQLTQINYSPGSIGKNLGDKISSIFYKNN